MRARLALLRVSWQGNLRSHVSGCWGRLLDPVLTAVRSWASLPLTCDRAAIAPWLLPRAMLRTSSCSNGNPFFAPDYFKAGLPDHPLDGELWGGRGQFSKTLSVAKTHKGKEGEWKYITYAGQYCTSTGGRHAHAQCCRGSARQCCSALILWRRQPQHASSY